MLYLGDRLDHSPSLWTHRNTAAVAALCVFSALHGGLEAGQGALPVIRVGREG